jgi:hypothetical protein
MFAWAFSRVVIMWNLQFDLPLKPKYCSQFSCIDMIVCAINFLGNGFYFNLTYVTHRRNKPWLSCVESLIWVIQRPLRSSDGTVFNFGKILFISLNFGYCHWGCRWKNGDLGQIHNWQPKSKNRYEAQTIDWQNRNKIWK